MGIAPSDGSQAPNRWPSDSRLFVHQQTCASTANDRCRTHFDKSSYRQRNVIGRAIGHLKEPLAIGTSYDKLAVNYEAMAQVTLIP